MRILTITFILFIAALSIACINGETKLLKDGTIISMDNGNKIVPYGHDLMELNYEVVLKELDSLWEKTGDLDYLSDYALVLTLNKEYKDASEIYLRIERLSPNRYSTASNLGTIYELMGNNQEAIKWIKKSYTINPQSHSGSEWLHVKILEAKIYGPEYIKSSFLVNTDFGTADSPQTTLTQAELVKLRDALYYQLNERVTFIKTPDPIIAQLMFDLGNVAWLTGAKKEAELIYLESKKYGFTDPLIDTRIAVLTGKTKPAKTLVKSDDTSGELKPGMGTWIALGAAVLVIILGFFIIRRRK